MLVIVFLSTIVIVYNQPAGLFYHWILYAQLFFYAAAAIGSALVRSGKRAGLFTIPFYFVFMNYCLVKGFIKFAKGNQSVLWEKSLRQAVE